MNTRIKHLAEQVYGSQATEQEIKFAELIVKECISYIDSRDYHSGSEGIAEHFGVEE